ncbi:MAG: PHP domain-containing protein, partial [Bacteroidota bacterium]
MHTSHSDGLYSAIEVVRRAKEAGLTTISITDHDNVSAIDEALEAAKLQGIDVIPGVELSAGVGEQEVHVLAYFFDHTNQNLLDYLKFFRIERKRRAERIVEKLNDLNIPLTLDAVLERAGHGSIGRPHIATALYEEGLTDSYHEAFYK